MPVGRREWLNGVMAAPVTGQAVGAQTPDSSIGSLYPFVQALADSQPQEESFLRPEFTDLTAWKPIARQRVLDHLFYAPAPVEPDPQLIRRTDRGDYIEEYLTFRTTPEIRVPAYVLVPKAAKGPAPAIVALHDHGGFYMWGKEKILQLPGESPVLTAFRQQYYGGKSTMIEMVRRGYVVVAIDMFYWGERRMLLPKDPASYAARPADMPEKEVNTFNARSGQNEQLVARSLYTAGCVVAGCDALGRHPHGELPGQPPGSGPAPHGLRRPFGGRVQKFHARCAR